MKKLYFIIIVLFVTANAFAKTKEFCGKFQSYSNNAGLMDSKGKEVISLSVQGGDPANEALLNQADELIGKNSGVKNKGGTQDGKTYCVVADVDAKDQPLKIVKAWLKK